MKRIYFCFLFWFGVFISISQNPAFIFANSMGNTAQDVAQSITYDSAGNLYVLGTYQGTADFDPSVGVFNLSSWGMSDIFFAKYDVNGNLVWAKSIGHIGSDKGSSILVDGLGNIFISGNFEGVVDFNPGGGINNLSSNGFQDVFFAKYDNNGNYIFAKGFGDGGGDDASKIALDGLGNIFVTGYFWGNPDFDPGPGTYFLSAIASTDVFFAKYDPNGNIIWAKHVGSTSLNYGLGMAVDSSGNSYLTGTFQGTGDFDPNIGVANLISNGQEDVYIAKYDNNGNYVWANKLGSSGGDWATYINVDLGGNILVTGYFAGVTDFDPNPSIYTLAPIGSIDIYFAKYTNSGNLIWAKCIGSSGPDWGTSIAIDNGGSYYLTGRFTGTADFNPGVLIDNLTANGGNDVFFAKFDTNGGYVWGKAFGGASDDQGNSICIDNCDNVIIAGYFSGATDFDASNSLYTLNSSGFRDAFFTKYTQTNLLANANPTTTICNGLSIQLICVGVGINTTYTWNPGNIFGQVINVTPTITTIYTVVSTSTAGCLGVGEISVAVITPTILVAGPDTICLDQSANLAANGGTSYVWQPGNMTGFLVTVNPTITTNYSVTGTDMNGCNTTTTINLTVLNCTGLKDRDAVSDGILIFPNPSKGIFLIELPNRLKNYVEILDCLGNIVRSFDDSNSRIEVNIENFSKGIYTIRIYNNLRTTTSKLVVN